MINGDRIDLDTLENWIIAPRDRLLQGKDYPNNRNPPEELLAALDDIKAEWLEGRKYVRKVR